MAPTNAGFGSTAPKPSQKRNSSKIASDSDSDAPFPAPKKAKGPTKSTKAATPSVTTSYTANDLEKLSRAELVAYAIDLQKRLDASKKSSSTSSNTQELSPEELKKKVEHLRTLMVRQIKKAMIITKLFARVIKDTGKAWKMKKLSAEDFEGAIDDIDASVRYGWLELTSDVTIRWDAENRTIKCSGKYGKRGTAVLNMKQAASVESD